MASSLRIPLGEPQAGVAGLFLQHALEDIEDLRSGWETVLPAWDVLGRVPGLKSKGFSHWDALLIGTCLQSGVERLISEDFGEAKRVDALEIVNPFEAFSL